MLGQHISLNHHHHFWHAPLGVYSAKRRHQSPECSILSHFESFIYGQVSCYYLNHTNEICWLTRDRSVHPRTTCQHWVLMLSVHTASCPGRLHRNTWQTVSSALLVLVITEYTILDKLIMYWKFSNKSQRSLLKNKPQTLHPSIYQCPVIIWVLSFTTTVRSCSHNVLSSFHCIYPY